MFKNSQILTGWTIVLMVALVACGNSNDNEPSHDQSVQGVMHAAGMSDPLNNCNGCHGSQLTGGSGPNCYGCHNANDHGQSRGGVLHLAGADASCATCHGPNNGGGLGPACADCH